MNIVPWILNKKPAKTPGILWVSYGTVDGRNPAPVDMVNIPVWKMQVLEFFVSMVPQPQWFLTEDGDFHRDGQGSTG